MKTSILLLAGAAVVLAQGDIGGLPACGQTCIGNMLGIAQSSFGCNPGDAVCYCTNANFGYGIRDCADQACPNAEDANTVKSFGVQYCQNYFASLSAAGNSVPPATAISAITETPTGTAASASGAAQTSEDSEPSSSPISTQALVATITADGSTITTTTGASTLFTVIGGAAASASDALASASASASDVLGSASSALASASDALASASGAASSNLADASGALSSALETVTGSASQTVTTFTSTMTGTSTSTGGAPMKTAAPILGAAGMAALLFL